MRNNKIDGFFSRHQNGKFSDYAIRECGFPNDIVEKHDYSECNADDDAEEDENDENDEDNDYVDEDEDEDDEDDNNDLANYIHDDDDDLDNDDREWRRWWTMTIKLKDNNPKYMWCVCIYISKTKYVSKKVWRI